MINVYTASNKILANLKPGTRVYAGDKSNSGIWCGIRKNGVKVVAWDGNIGGHKNADEYVAKLMKYAKG